MSTDVISSLPNISHGLELTLCARLGTALSSARRLVLTVASFLNF